MGQGGIGLMDCGLSPGSDGHGKDAMSARERQKKCAGIPTAIKKNLDTMRKTPYFIHYHVVYDRIIFPGASHA